MGGLLLLSRESMKLKPKTYRVLLTPQQKDKLLTWLFFGLDKSVIIKRFLEEETVDLTDYMYTYWKKRADKRKDETVKAVARYREKMFEKGYSGRLARLDTLYAQVDKGLRMDFGADDHLAFQRVTKTVLDTLKQIAQELHEWQTGDTVNIVYNIINPVFEEVAFVLVRHLPEGEPRIAALDDLRRVSESYMKSLPAGKAK